MNHSERRSRHALIPVYALLCSLIVLSRFIVIPLPIPITMQLLFTNTGALLLGRRGVIPPLIYLSLGLIGLPIFTTGGGIGSILEPTFGFILGMAVGALVTGLIRERARGTAGLVVASASGLACVYLCGCVYFALLQGVYFAEPINLTYATLIILSATIFMKLCLSFFQRKNRHKMVSVFSM